MSARETHADSALHIARLEDIFEDPPILRGRIVSLVPLSQEHADSLTAAGAFEELWRWVPVSVRDAAEMMNYIAEALLERRSKAGLPFAILDRASGAFVGSTRYLNVASSHRRLEIGATWITPAFQRTGVNTEAKYLMLGYAFDTLAMQRVELKADALNVKSRTAILRIGAVEEGLLRKHMIMECGRSRDTVYYSILKAEWPNVRVQLEEMLRHYESPGMVQPDVL